MKLSWVFVAAILLVAVGLWATWLTAGGNASNGGGRILTAIFNSEPAEFARLDRLRAEKDSGPDFERRTQAMREYGEGLSRLDTQDRARYVAGRQEVWRQQAYEKVEDELDWLQSMSREELVAMFDELIDRIESNDPEIVQFLADTPRREAAAGQSQTAPKQSLQSRSARQRAMEDEINRLLSIRMTERGVPMPPGLRIAVGTTDGTQR